ncbi:hypothetical protein SAMN05421736_11534 [Evansella caseinilytica]|uniref:Uncharacterized protein n=1 Tax=Evansella caseinilytica TaxID=1503961 RepID=A0A1H3TKV0_9BACI|nr:hypothetical protein [Evansella caseinilytica]SDZ50617.1 hypothetical protein SAMN05421736_11534 [Evansella caseinilytica]
MEKGLFAVYKNKTYKVSNINGNIIRLVSQDKIDLNNDFNEKKYPSNIQNKDSLPKLFIKEVKRAEIDEIYEIDYDAKYKGKVYSLSFNKQNSEFWLGTNDAELARKYGFERTDKYYYEKRVELTEIEIIKKKKNM